MDHDALATVPLFAGIDDDEVRTFAARFEEKRVFMGERLAEKDDYGYSFFIVLEGRVRIDVDATTSVELGAGDHFGEIALVTGSKRTASVTAVENCRLARTMTWDFQELMDQSPAVAERIKAAAEARSRSSAPGQHQDPPP